MWRFDIFFCNKSCDILQKIVYGANFVKDIEMKIFLAVALLVAVCEAHLCLFNPHQRGSMDMVNTAGIKVEHS